MLRVSVIIPTFKRDDRLPDALRSLQQQSLAAGEFEIVVVDNASSDATAALVDQVSSSGHPVRYIREPRLGLQQARHAGVRASTAPILAYCDDDATYSPDWLSALLPHYEDQRVGAVGGPIRLQFPQDAPAWCGSFQDQYAGLDMGDTVRELRWPFSLYGPNYSVRRTALLQAGGFDPDQAGEQWFGPGESGLTRKLLDGGWKMIYEPKAWATHHISQERARKEFVIERFHKQASCSAYLDCNGDPGRLAIAFRAVKFAAAAIPLTVAGSLARLFGSDVQELRARGLAAYARGRAAFDFKLLFSGPPREAISRRDWLSQ